MQNNNFLLKYAVQYLSKYTSSKKNLQRILKSKINRLSQNKKERAILYQNIEHITQQLEKNNLISDNEYTINKIIFFAKNGKSQNYIKNYLFIKGINKKIISDQLALFENNNPNWEKESAILFAKKKQLFGTKYNYEKKLTKMSQAGFSYTLSKEILTDY